MNDMQGLFSEIIDKHHLTRHPFYIAWDEGKLTRKRLGIYSCEYGTFIRMIAKGWSQIGEEQIAKEEMDHYFLWEIFSDSVCPQIISAKLRPSIQLLWTTENNFKHYATALGALYGFEAQQSLTARLKLKGIRKHYAHWKLDEQYFEKHVGDELEPELLAQKIAQLNDTEKNMAAVACATQCLALWDALTGIMAAREN